jgi:ABC-type dipeptide/oligopeptide/nickel transport system permease subunit
MVRELDLQSPAGAILLDTATTPARRSRRTRIGRLLPVAALGLLGCLAVAWPLVAPYEPLENLVARPLRPPSAEHWFGTDQFGRDIFSRVLAGTRISLTVGLLATGLATVLGVVLGSIASVARGWVDEAVMRCLDVALAFPGILLAIVLAAGLGNGQRTVVIVLAIVYTPAMARVARALISAELRQDYVASARLLGSGTRRVLTYHVGANIVVPILAFAVTIVAEVILVEAALSFIGVGIPPPTPSWGSMIAEGRSFLLSGSWWTTLFPGLAVFLTVLVLNVCAAALGRRLATGSGVRS